MDSKSQYLIEQINLRVDRFPDVLENEVFDIKGSVVELNIFESIELPYLTANLAMVDDVAFKSTIGIKGTERIQILLKATENTAPVEKNFIVTGIVTEVSVNERTDVRVLSLMEEHSYLSSIEKVSRTFEGRPSIIIRDILNNYLDKNLTTFQSFENPTTIDGNFFTSTEAQGNIRYISPYLYPLQICDLIRDRMTTSHGAPYFLFSTFRDDYVHLLDLETIMKAPAWNSSTPYTYAQGASTFFNNSDSKDDQRKRSYFHVKKYKAANIESTLRTVQGGAMGSVFEVMNLYSGQITQDNFHSGSETLNEFLSVIGENPDTSFGFDDTLKIGSSSRTPDQRVSEYTGRVFRSIVSSHSFFSNGNPIPGFHDIVDNPVEHKLKIKSAALRSILMNNLFTITVPGTPYLADLNVGVGTNIDLNYVEPTLSKTNNSSVDPNRSGKFMIYKAAHKFSEGIHETTMDIVKLTGASK